MRILLSELRKIIRETLSEAGGGKFRGDKKGPYKMSLDKRYLDSMGASPPGHWEHDEPGAFEIDEFPDSWNPTSVQNNPDSVDLTFNSRKDAKQWRNWFDDEHESKTRLPFDGKMKPPANKTPIDNDQRGGKVLKDLTSYLRSFDEPKIFATLDKQVKSGKSPGEVFNKTIHKWAEIKNSVSDFDDDMDPDEANDTIVDILSRWYEKHGG
jgi:hypothetical protein